ncbi:MAG: helix-turn-helix transcriptional regulator [Bacteroidales bacterium]|nr:helix-turn-helix transcriptional regulator [Bacteroidales bacterium]
MRQSFPVTLIVLTLLVAACNWNPQKRQASVTPAEIDEKTSEPAPEEVAATSASIHLAKREKQVARLIMDGKTTKEIAYEMGVSEQTVLWYRKRLYAKLNVHSAVQFASEMQKLGLDK